MTTETYSTLRSTITNSNREFCRAMNTVTSCDEVEKYLTVALSEMNVLGVVAHKLLTKAEAKEFEILVEQNTDSVCAIANRLYEQLDE